MNTDDLLVGEALPRFDTVFDYPERLAALAGASQSLAVAVARYRTLYATAWWSSWFDHASKQGLDVLTDVFGFVDRGLAQANTGMLELQNSEHFLESQQELVTSLTRFRNCHRDVAEAWQLWNHAPTRGDVDELAESFYELRREVRRLRRQVQDHPREAQAPPGTTHEYQSEVVHEAH